MPSRCSVRYQFNLCQNVAHNVTARCEVGGRQLQRVRTFHRGNVSHVGQIVTYRYDMWCGTDLTQHTCATIDHEDCRASISTPWARSYQVHIRNVSSLKDLDREARIDHIDYLSEVWSV